jgi:hypothetical protein
MLSKTNMEKRAELLLRVGLAFVFAYAAIAAFRDPTAWVGFVPLWVSNIVPLELFMKIHAAGELALALWLLSGWKTYYAAVLSALAIAGIVVFNFGAMDLVFRDIGLFFAALGLAALSRESKAADELQR